MKDVKGVLFIAILAILIAIPAIGFAKTPTKSNTAMAKSQKAVDVAGCYECHDTIKSMHMGNLHKDVNCISCHDSLAAHMDDMSIRPAVDFSWQACGACHQDQMKTLLTTSYHRPARDDKSQPTNRIPIWYDKLMSPHGFTKEHAITRPHVMGLIDQFVVDRAFGGRFQPKNGWEYVLEIGTVWEVLEDKYPDVKGQKKFLPQTATAANPVCMSCKTADLILEWPYMGDPGTGAKWDRTSDVVEMAKATTHALNCFFCHDPHSAQPRIVRDALIDAISDPNGDTLWHNDPNRTKVNIITLGERGYDRKIGILEKADSRLMCAQCHVEYNCNAGTNPNTGEVTNFSSRLTNHFPLKDVMHLYDHYFVKLQFADFKNSFDGAWLWKGQHPEFETYYNSDHSKAGIGCAECHMPVMNKGKKNEFTSHFAESPRYVMKETCLTANCHPQWTAEQGKYVIDSIKAYTKGRMRKSEFWLSTLIDKIEQARVLGVDQKTLAEARTAHSKAHILWEYWTAENSDGFHNPQLARESLTTSIDISTEAIGKLDKAINEKVSAMK